MTGCSTDDRYLQRRSSTELAKQLKYVLQERRRKGARRKRLGLQAHSFCRLSWRAIAPGAPPALTCEISTLAYAILRTGSLRAEESLHSMAPSWICNESDSSKFNRCGCDAGRTACARIGVGQHTLLCALRSSASARSTCRSTDAARRLGLAALAAITIIARSACACPAAA